MIRFSTSDKIACNFANDTVTNYFADSTRVFRDTSAWYHIVVSCDTTQSTASDRVKIYVNGELETITGGATTIPQNRDTDINVAAQHRIGAEIGNRYYSDGYIANACFIDGQQLDPTYFGEYEGTLWKPKSNSDVVNLNFGTNGFYLPFKQTTQAEGFSTVTYTGNGLTSQSVEGVGFEPDFIWIKHRSGSGWHRLQNTVVGINKLLYSNSTTSEATNEVNGYVSSTDANGFTLADPSTNGAGVNGSGQNYVAWCWDAGSGSATSNTDGSITSTVKANTAKGFSIVSYTGTGANATVGHGLSSAPEIIIPKNRDYVSGTHWDIYASPIGAGNILRLNSTLASTASAPNWNSTAPTSSVFTVGTSNSTNRSGDGYIAYCFHSVSGYSSIGSYTGTGAAGNSITGLGFKPAWLMYKRSDSTGNWIIHDNTRVVEDDKNKRLYPNVTNAEQTVSPHDVTFDSDGFTMNTVGNDGNASGGTYIYMAFADTRDATFFGDTSGNSNNWTPNALNNTDVLPDSPVTGGNFASWNPISQQTSSTTFSEGNLKALIPASTANGKAMPTMGVSSGKWYWEYYYSVSNGNYLYVGITDPSAYTNNSYWIRGSDGETFKYENGTNSTGSGTTHRHTQGDIIQVAFDADNGKWYVGKNGTWSFSGDPVAGTGYVHNNIVSGEYGPFASNATSSNTQTTILNTGADSSFAGNATPQGNTDSNGVGDFYYAPPSGFLALTTSNLPAATITAPDEYFNTVLYTGTGATRSVTGVGFQPDWIWTKARSNASNHNLIDAVRGTNKLLLSDVSDAEYTQTIIDSFDSDGFTTSSSASGINLSGYTYVAWNWLASNNTVSNTDGSITSTVSANQTAGFSVVGYTGTGANATVGHGLSSAPEMIIVKNRTSALGWPVYHSANGATKFMQLEITNAVQTASTVWQDTTPTSSVFSVGTSTYVNQSSSNFIAYCFAEIEGYSKIGSYTGNGSTNGTFVHCGFRPAWVMFKRTDTTGNWWMIDSKRDITNQMSNILLADSSSAEFNTGTGWPGIDYVSSYIFLAFAEAPFKSANAR
jgi:hypothetical protein